MRKSIKIAVKLIGTPKMQLPKYYALADNRFGLIDHDNCYSYNL